MGPISLTTLVDAPRERVFELIADLACRAAFTDHFASELRLTRTGSTGVGAAARFELDVRPLGWTESAIESVEPPHLVRERGSAGRSGRIPVITVWELAERAGPMTEVKLAFWTEPSHPLDRLRESLGAERRLERRWATALRRLRDLAEAGDAATVDRVTVGGLSTYEFA